VHRLTCLAHDSRRDAVHGNAAGNIIRNGAATADDRILSNRYVGQDAGARPDEGVSMARYAARQGRARPDLNAIGQGAVMIHRRARVQDTMGADFRVDIDDCAGMQRRSTADRRMFRDHGRRMHQRSERGVRALEMIAQARPDRRLPNAQDEVVRRHKGLVLQ